MAAKNKERIPERAAYEITLFPPDQQAGYCQRFVDGLMNLQQLHDARKGKRKEPPFKFRIGPVTVTMPPVLEVGKASFLKALEAIKKLERDGGSIDKLPGLVG